MKCWRPGRHLRDKMPEIRIRKREQAQVPAWSDALVSSATFTALDSWSRVVRDMYGYEIHCFEAGCESEVTGWSY